MVLILLKFMWPYQFNYQWQESIIKAREDYQARLS